MNKLEVRFNLPDDRSQRGCNFIFQAVAASDWFLFISVTGCCWVYCLQPAAAQTCCSLSQSPRTLVMPAVCMEGVWSKLVHSPVHTGERLESALISHRNSRDPDQDSVGPLSPLLSLCGLLRVHQCLHGHSCPCCLYGSPLLSIIVSTWTPGVLTVSAWTSVSP